jgi:uncharacterized repeat protein (TIGR04076 family)
VVRYKTVATVKSLIGKCPNGNKVGDRIEISSGQVTGIKCPSAFNSIYPTVCAMRYGAELPWLKDKNIAVSQCPDPEHCVTFEIRREKETK